MMRLLMVFGLIAALSGPAIAQDESPYFAEIPAKLLRILDTQIAPLLQVGELDQATDLLMVMLPKADPKVVDAIDQRLKDLKLPAGSELFTDRVIRRVEAGLVDMRKQPSSTELGLMVPVLVDRLEKAFEKADIDPRVTGKQPLPQDWNDAEEFFWGFHVIKNELDSSVRLGEFGQQISRRFLRSKRNDRDEAIIELAEQFPDLTKKLVSLKSQLIEHEALYRLTQLNEAVARIGNAANFEDKFIGMTSLVSAQYFFEDFFDDYNSERLTDPVLSAEDFEAQTIAKIKSSQAGNPKLLTKVQLFQSGLHWWFRGRYGAAELRNGLLKAPEAMKSPDAMFGLFMPRERPTPTVPFAKASMEQASAVPEYQRRHYYTWPLGEQQFKTNRQVYDTPAKRVNYVEVATFERFY